MSEYVTKPIGEVADIRRGASPRPIDDWMSDTGIPWVKISDATRSDSRFIYETEGFIREDGKSKSVEVFPEDLIISNSATPGLPRIMKIHACIHDGWLLADNFKGITRDYLFYQIKYMRKYLVNQGNGSIFTNLKTDILKEFPIRIPIDDKGKLDETVQIAVVNVLSSLEDKIENNTAICSDLESMAKLLYDYWFVQFDFPDENGRPYKSSGGKMVWNEELKREIPEGWEAASISRIAKILPGGTPSKAISKFWDNGTIPFFGPTDYQNTVFQFDTKDYITEDGLNSCASSLFEYGTVLITARGSIGKLVIVGSPMAMNQSCYAFKPLNENHVPYLYFISEQVIEYLKVKGSGSVFKSIIVDDIESSLLPIGTEKTVGAFCQKVEPMFERIMELEKENQQLTSLRDFLLPMLMNGQVKVADKTSEE